MKLIFKYLTSSEALTSSLIGLEPFKLSAWLFYFFLMSIFTDYSSTKDGYTHVPEEPLGLFGFFIPIFVAYVSYHIVITKLGIKAVEEIK